MADKDLLEQYSNELDELFSFPELSIQPNNPTSEDSSITDYYNEGLSKINQASQMSDDYLQMAQDFPMENPQPAQMSPQYLQMAQGIDTMYDPNNLPTYGLVDKVGDALAGVAYSLGDTVANMGNVLTFGNYKTANVAEDHDLGTWGSNAYSIGQSAAQVGTTIAASMVPVVGPGLAVGTAGINAAANYQSVKKSLVNQGIEQGLSRKEAEGGATAGSLMSSTIEFGANLIPLLKFGGKLGAQALGKSLEKEATKKAAKSTILDKLAGQGAVTKAVHSGTGATYGIVNNPDFVRRYVKSAATKNVAKDVLGEGVTEGIQGRLEQWGLSWSDPNMTREDIWRGWEEDLLWGSIGAGAVHGLAVPSRKLMYKLTKSNRFNPVSQYKGGDVLNTEGELIGNLFDLPIDDRQREAVNIKDNGTKYNSDRDTITVPADKVFKGAESDLELVSDDTAIIVPKESTLPDAKERPIENEYATQEQLAETRKTIIQQTVPGVTEEQAEMRSLVPGSANDETFAKVTEGSEIQDSLFGQLDTVPNPDPKTNTSNRFVNDVFANISPEEKLKQIQKQKASGKPINTSDKITANKNDVLKAVMNLGDLVGVDIRATLEEFGDNTGKKDSKKDPAGQAYFKERMIRVKDIMDFPTVLHEIMDTLYNTGTLKHKRPFSNFINENDAPTIQQELRTIYNEEFQPTQERVAKYKEDPEANISSIDINKYATPPTPPKERSSEEVAKRRKDFDEANTKKLEYVKELQAASKKRLDTLNSEISELEKTKKGPEALLTKANKELEQAQKNAAKVQKTVEETGKGKKELIHANSLVNKAQQTITKINNQLKALDKRIGIRQTKLAEETAVYNKRTDEIKNVQQKIKQDEREYEQKEDAARQEYEKQREDYTAATTSEILSDVFANYVLDKQNFRETLKKKAPKTYNALEQYISQNELSKAVDIIRRIHGEYLSYSLDERANVNTSEKKMKIINKVWGSLKAFTGKLNKIHNVLAKTIDDIAAIRAAGRETAQQMREINASLPTDEQYTEAQINGMEYMGDRLEYLRGITTSAANTFIFGNGIKINGTDIVGFTNFETILGSIVKETDSKEDVVKKLGNLNTYIGVLATLGESVKNRQGLQLLINLSNVYGSSMYDMYTKLYDFRFGKPGAFDALPKTLQSTILSTNDYGKAFLDNLFSNLIEDKDRKETPISFVNALRLYDEYQQSPDIDILKEAANNYQKYWDALLNLVSEMSPEMGAYANAIKESGAGYYTPLMRPIVEAMDQNENYRAVRKEGSTRPSYNILDNTVSATEGILKIAYKSALKHNLVQFTNIFGGGRYVQRIASIDEIADIEAISKALQKRLPEQLDTIKKLEKAADERNISEIGVTVKNPKALPDNIIREYNAKTHSYDYYFVTEPALVEALRNPPEHTNLARTALQVMDTINAMQKAGFVSVNPFFLAVKNPTRDVFTESIKGQRVLWKTGNEWLDNTHINSLLGSIQGMANAYWLAVTNPEEFTNWISHLERLGLASNKQANEYKAMVSKISAASVVPNTPAAFVFQLKKLLSYMGNSDMLARISELEYYMKEHGLDLEDLDVDREHIENLALSKNKLESLGLTKELITSRVGLDADQLTIFNNTPDSATLNITLTDAQIGNVRNLIADQNLGIKTSTVSLDERVQLNRELALCTTDFLRTGRWSAGLNRVILFARATINGTSQYGDWISRRVGQGKTGELYGRLLSGAIEGLLFASMFGDDDEDEESLWNGIRVRVGDTTIDLPMLAEDLAAFNLGRSLARGELGLSFISNFLKSINPVTNFGIIGTALDAVSGRKISPIGRSDWGDPIIPKYMEDKYGNAIDRIVNQNTSWAAIAFGKMFGISPMTVNYFLKNSGLGWLDNIAEAATGVDRRIVATSGESVGMGQGLFAAVAKQIGIDKPLYKTNEERELEKLSRRYSGEYHANPNDKEAYAKYLLTYNAQKILDNIYKASTLATTRTQYKELNSLKARVARNSLEAIQNSTADLDTFRMTASAIKKNNKYRQDIVDKAIREGTSVKKALQDVPVIPPTVAEDETTSIKPSQNMEEAESSFKLSDILDEVNIFKTRSAAADDTIDKNKSIEHSMREQYANLYNKAQNKNNKNKDAYSYEIIREDVNEYAKNLAARPLYKKSKEAENTFNATPAFDSSNIDEATPSVPYKSTARIEVSDKDLDNKNWVVKQTNGDVTVGPYQANSKSELKEFFDSGNVLPHTKSVQAPQFFKYPKKTDFPKNPGAKVETLYVNNIKSVENTNITPYYKYMLDDKGKFVGLESEEGIKRLKELSKDKNFINALVKFHDDRFEKAFTESKIPSGKDNIIKQLAHSVFTYSGNLNNMKTGATDAETIKKSLKTVKQNNSTYRDDDRRLAKEAFAFYRTALGKGTIESNLSLFDEYDIKRNPAIKTTKNTFKSIEGIFEYLDKEK